MASIDPYCSNRDCSGLPSWFTLEALLALSRCPTCARKLRFRCSACGHAYGEDAGTLEWCPFCGVQFDRAASA